MHIKSKIIILVVFWIIVFSINELLCFVPRRANFANDYQHQLYTSWILRSGFSPYSPASLSHQLIRTTYDDPVNLRKVPVEFDLEETKIYSLREVVTHKSIDTEIPHVERQYRYFLELILFRLNSEKIFFGEDILDGLEVTLVMEDEQMENPLEYLINQERLIWEKFAFSHDGDNSYIYDVTLNSGSDFQLIFPNISALQALIGSSRQKELHSAHIEQLRKESLIPTYSARYPPTSQIMLPPTAFPNRDMPLKDYINTYREHIWGREMLHNKITNPRYFLSDEFPHHDLVETSDSFELRISPFRDNINADINLVKRNLKDGIVFESLGHYEINSSKTVQLSTGDMISLSELDNSEIAIIAPYLSQLITMHRVMGTKLLNFLLIPADVPTTLVLRDPEREVSEFVSYTSLILMLSHYWQDRVVYFDIERVKKVNNYVELNGFLVANHQEGEVFDFAEVKFALSRSFRIDLAMVILHTNIPVQEDLSP